MIDTDKYEGHSTTWTLDYNDWTWAESMFTGAGITNEADAQLIADAPLLLAEVKRLREVISRAISTLLDNPPEELLEFTSPTPAQDIGDLIGFYEQAMGYAIGILEGTE